MRSGGMRETMTPDEWLTRLCLGADNPHPQRDTVAGRNAPPMLVDSTGGVIGNVLDARGRAVRARVSLRRADGGAARECLPLDDEREEVGGWFQLCGLPPG